MGLLDDGIDPAEIQKWMAQFGATAADQKNADKQAAFALGFGLLGGRKGNELATIGQAGLGAMGARQSYLDNAIKERGANIGQALNAIKASKDVQFTNAGLGLLRGDQSQAPQAAPQSAPEFGMNDRSMGAMPPSSIAPQQTGTASPSSIAPAGTPWANPRTELGMAMMGKKDVADVIHRQYQVTQGPSGTLLRNGQIVGQVIPNAGMVVDGQFQALPKEALDAMVGFEGAKAGAVKQAENPYQITEGMDAQGRPVKGYAPQVFGQPPVPGAPVSPATSSGGRISVNLKDASPEAVQWMMKDIANQGGSAPGGALTGPNPIQQKRAEGQVASQTAQDTKINENFAQTFNDAISAEYQAPGKIAKLQQLRSYLSNVDTGKGAPTVQNLKAVAAYIAPDLAKEWTKDIPYAQAAQQLSNEMALQLRSPAGGGGMPGSLSDADREFLMKLIPTIGNDPRSLSMATDAKIALAKREQELGKLAREYRQSRGQIDEGFYAEAQKFSDTHPLFAGVAGPASKTMKFSDLPQ